MREHAHSGPIKANRPLIVFAGRSNVGKSSIIRSLTGKKVRVGKRPGSTRWEQWIDLESVTIVDIPGFGYMASAGKAEIEKTKTMVIQKLERWSDRIVLAVLIIDISLFRKLVERWENRGEIPIDIEFYNFLNEISPQVLVVVNKIDKLKKSQLRVEISYLIMKLRESLSSKEPQVVEVSASKRIGLPRLKDTISDMFPDIKIWD